MFAEPPFSVIHQNITKNHCFKNLLYFSHWHNKINKCKLLQIMNNGSMISA